MGRIDLGVDAEAHAILTKAIGKNGRRQVEGLAIVRVLENHVDGKYDVFRVKVIRGAAWQVGREITMPRRDLYASTEPGELAEFRKFVELIWPSRS